MRVANLEVIVGDYLAATRHVIIHSRGGNGVCRFCGSPRGQQHSADCALWPLVSARIAHHMAVEGPAPAATANPVQTMTMLEAGGDLAPPAPTLLYADSGYQR